MKIYAFADEASPSIDSQIVAMKRNGLDGIEIRNVDGTNVSSITVDKAKEVKAKFDAAGLEVWSVGSPIGKIVITDNFEKHLDSLRHTCEIANILDSKNIRMFSFFIPKGTNADDYKNEVIEKLGKMLEVSKQYNVNLCHENETTDNFFEKFRKPAELLRQGGKYFMYHNHAHEFMKIDGKTILEIFAEGMDKDIMGVTLDTYWVQKAGGEEGINGLTLSNAMHLSDFLDREITLPIDADLYKEELMKRVAVSNKEKGTVEVFEDNTSSFGNV